MREVQGGRWELQLPGAAGVSPAVFWVRSRLTPLQHLERQVQFVEVKQSSILTYSGDGVEAEGEYSTHVRAH